ncbi:WD40/YVTN/BNR-like repeat-containing protein [Paraburkholderia phytofirmans]|uniref:WD40/YVTN/BNR-like repeat-containing protein n=1 Tax=Paraburkholderia phytofirmans TaxID=261302 RepID=UPI0038B903F5
MRVLIAFIGFWFLLSTVAANAGQGFVDPLSLSAQAAAHPGHSPLTAITSVGNRLIAVGWRGLITYSDDGGKSWRQAHAPVSVDLTGVDFPTLKDGWAVGHDGIILHTDDGGLTWTEQLNGVQAAAIAVAYFQQKVDAGDAGVRSLLDDAKAHQTDNASNPFLSVRFVSPTDGYAVGSFGLSMHTTDAGKSWAPFGDRIDNPEALNLFGIGEYKGNLYIASEKGTVFVMEHGTDRFIRRSTGYSGSLFGVVGGGSGVVAYGLRGHVFRSSDGGANWSAMDGTDGATVTGATSLADGRVALVNLGGAVMESDVGLTKFASVTGTPGVVLSGIAGGPDGGLTVVGMGGAHTFGVR